MLWRPHDLSQSPIPESGGCCNLPIPPGLTPMEANALDSGHRLDRERKSCFFCSSVKLQHSVNCCDRERFWKADAVRSALEMDKYNTIQYTFRIW